MWLQRRRDPSLLIPTLVIARLPSDRTPKAFSLALPLLRSVMPAVATRREGSYLKELVPDTPNWANFLRKFFCSEKSY
jgi:hypothetical protein